jgi:hypothetical protein
MDIHHHVHGRKRLRDDDESTSQFSTAGGWQNKMAELLAAIQREDWNRVQALRLIHLQNPQVREKVYQLLYQSHMTHRSLDHAPASISSPSHEAAVQGDGRFHDQSAIAHHAGYPHHTNHQMGVINGHVSNPHGCHACGVELRPRCDQSLHGSSAHQHAAARSYPLAPWNAAAQTGGTTGHALDTPPSQTLQHDDRRRQAAEVAALHNALNNLQGSSHDVVLGQCLDQLYKLFQRLQRDPEI